jgi:hypothetical protein
MTKETTMVVKSGLGAMMREALRQSAIEAGELDPSPAHLVRKASTVDRILERQFPGWIGMSRAERDACWFKHFGWASNPAMAHRGLNNE